MEKSYWSFNFLTGSLLIISLAIVLSFAPQTLLPVPGDVWTLMQHETHQYYTRPTRAGPYAERVVELQLHGRWQPQLYRLGPHLQYNNLWCLQVEVTILKNNTRIKESTEWIAVKPLHRPWQLFPLEPVSGSQVWEQRCGRQARK